MPHADEDYQYTDEEPLNREPDIENLISSFITKKDGYDRNHSVIPSIDPESHIVLVEGEVETPLQLTVNQLRTEFAQHEVVCSLQCAGNRRHTMRTTIKEVHGIDWFDGAVMNCVWRGPRLKDILELAGIKDSMRIRRGEKVVGWKGHVACVCQEKPCQDSPEYGGSITLERAMLDDGDCILALEMNGKPLMANHGAPVRGLFPGILGARSVKWLNRISVQMTESNNFYQQRDYKILPPEATCPEVAKKYWSQTPSMMDMPVNSIIGVPITGTSVNADADGAVEVRGYALPAGMDGPVVKVDVSGDDGKTWIAAELDFGGYENPGLDTMEGRRGVRWAWCLWKAKVKVPKGHDRKLLSRATDWKGNIQPRESPWNLRGVGYNAWGEVNELSVE